MATKTAKSFCRLCSACCGTVVSLNEKNQVVACVGDKDDLMTKGYACFKGMRADQLYYHKNRILHPLKKTADGSFVQIDLEDALDEIATKIGAIIAEHGPEAVAGFRGSGSLVNASAALILHNFLESIGSHKSFSPYTIDQSAKNISVGRIGYWPAGRHNLHDSDVRMFFGVNPVVSILSSYLDWTNPTKKLKEAKARGMKLIVIDPRRTETAKFADIFLQPYPGEDSTIAAGFIKWIIDQQLYDQSFCRQYVGDLDRLYHAVSKFSPDYVAKRAGIDKDDFIAAATLFAKHCSVGGASTGTGPNMAPHSNLTEHLVECINIICGRYIKEGELFRNPSVLRPKWPRKAQVIPPSREWEHSYKSRIGGYGMLTPTIGMKYGEMMTGIFTDEILTPGEGQVRCVINHGSNLANIVPDQRKVYKALESLELLVNIEPYMTETSKLSDYILPTKLYYERPDLSHFMFASEIAYNLPYARYTPAVAEPPEGSEVVDDWEIVWGLAKRLNVPLHFDGVPLDMENKPSTDDLIKIVSRYAPIDFEEFKSMPVGKIFSEIEQIVLPPDAGNNDKFTTMPADVEAELKHYYDNYETPQTEALKRAYPFKLVSRRLRDYLNTTGRDVPELRARIPLNYAYMNPDDMLKLGISSNDSVQIESVGGAIKAVAMADPAVKASIVSMAHGWGGHPDSDDYKTEGSSTNLLISTDRDLDPINAMPWMSAIPITIVQLEHH